MSAEYNAPGPDLVEAVRAKSDKMKVTVVTRSFQFDGFMHTPKIGKESRRLSDTLNADRNFITITQVAITNRLNGSKDPITHPLIQVALGAIEFVKPHFDD